jgi:hypothetical protein
MMKRFFLLAIFTFLLHSATAAQDGRPDLKPPTSEQDITLPDEMRARLAIERADAEHRKFLEDVKKLGDLSNEITTGFDKRGTLASEDIKKLATIEKLAKRILGHAGGKEVDDKTTGTSQLSVKDAIAQLGDAVGKITKTVMAETRHVVSATVIEQSNEAIKLAQFIRHSQDQK